MQKILLSLLVILTFGGYLYFKNFHGLLGDDDVKVTPPTSSQNSSSSETTNSNSDQTSAGTPPPSPSPVTISGSFKDGTYTGKVADAYYGNLQVKATISGGKISDVQFLQYPNDRPTSIEINTQAMPLLKQEAIQAQSSQVDIVSGATQTSNAFRETLQSALDQAK